MTEESRQFDNGGVRKRGSLGSNGFLTSLTEGSTAFAKLVFTLTLTFTLLSVSWFTYREINTRFFVVEPFEVSGLGSQHYRISGKTVANRLVDRLNYIKDSVRTRRAYSWGQFHTSWYKEQVVIEAFESTVNFTAVMRAVIKFFGGGPTTISGEIVTVPRESTDSYFLSVRPSDKTGGREKENASKAGYEKNADRRSSRNGTPENGVDANSSKSHPKSGASSENTENADSNGSSDVKAQQHLPEKKKDLLNLELSLRIQGEPGETFVQSFGSLDKLIVDAADYCYAKRGPYYLALFYWQEAEKLENLGDYLRLPDARAKRSIAMQKAERYAKLAVERKPEDPWAYILLGIISKERYREILERGVGSDNRYFNKSCAKFSKAITRALESGKRKATREEALAPAYSGLADLYSLRGSEDDKSVALEFYREAFAARETDPLHMVQYAQQELRDGDGICRASNVMVRLLERNLPENKRGKPEGGKTAYLHVRDELKHWCADYSDDLELECGVGMRKMACEEPFSVKEAVSYWMRRRNARH